MKVYELIALLQKCSQDATVCVEVDRDPEASSVCEYHTPDGGKYVYIADDTDYLDGAMIDGTIKKEVK